MTVDLLELDDMLTDINTEMRILGMPKTLIDRVDALQSVIPMLEAAREKHQR